MLVYKTIVGQAAEAAPVPEAAVQPAVPAVTANGMLVEVHAVDGH